MSEKEGIHKSQPEQSDVTPIPEKEESGKLDQLDPEELVPPELANIPEIAGHIQAVAHKSGSAIDYVIVDEGQMTLRQIAEGFTYFDEEKLEEYAELSRGKNTYARPLAAGSVRQISPDILFGGIFETNPAFRGKGMGVIFQEHIAVLAKKLGFKFFAGYQNDAETARFFLKRGRYLLEEIRDEFQGELQSIRDQESDEAVFYTVKFLDPEDIAKYVKPERINTDIEDKIEYKEKILTLNNIFSKLIKTFVRVEDGEEELGDRATLIEILEDLNQLLPQDEQSSASTQLEDDVNLLTNLKILLEHLKSKSDTLIRIATLEQLKENDV